MFFLLFFYAKDLYLKPVLSKRHPSSFVAQLFTINLDSTIQKISFSLGKAGKGRMFYADQISGPRLEYFPNYNQTDYPYLAFFNQNQNFHEGKYQFKINSDFKKNDTLNVRLYYQMKQNDMKYKCILINNSADSTQIRTITKENIFTIKDMNFMNYASKIIRIILFLYITINLRSQLSSINHVLYSFLILFPLFNFDFIPKFIYLYLFIMFRNDTIYLLIISLYVYTSMIDSFFLQLMVFCFLIYYKTLFQVYRKAFNFLIFYIFLFYVITNLHDIVRKISLIDNTNGKYYITYYENKKSYLLDDIYEIKKAADQSFSLENCNYCNFVPTLKPTSTKRDLIIIQIGGQPERSINSLISLRKTGCQAKVVATLSPNDILSNEFKEIQNNCGVATAYLNSSLYFEIEKYMKFMRYSILSEFLEKFGKYYDRILYFDAYDSIFQYDPFPNKTEFKSRTLYLSPEMNKFGPNILLNNWMQTIPGVDPLRFADEEGISTGVFCADTKTIIALGQMMKALYMKDGEFIINDQALYDYLIYSGQLSNVGIKLEVRRQYPSVSMALNLVEGVYYPMLRVNQTHPAIIHQFNKDKDFNFIFSQVCSTHNHNHNN